MKYLIALETPQQVADALMKDPKGSIKQMKEMMAHIKPEVSYFSTTRRYSIMVVDVKDPHMELRRIYENLSKMGEVTVEPLSTFEEFIRFVEQMQSP